MHSPGPSPSQSKGCPWHGKLSGQEAIEHRWDLALDAKNLHHPEFTANSLTVSAQHAWRNAARCVGRLHWKSLQVHDARSAQTPADVAAALAQHLRLAASKGRIESWTTLFRAWDHPESEIRIWNHQLYGYAFHGITAETSLGDPRNATLTQIAQTLGWQAPSPATHFDLLPWIIQVGDRLELHEIPRDLRHEVTLRHPKLSALERLGLKWYPIPVLSDMILATGDMSFSAAPFNGWYMGTEVGRNLSDLNRYNCLPKLAAALNLDTTRERSLWRDHALVLLNEAILHSFNVEGWTMVDHHAASQEFIRFEERETSEGRKVSGDWSWLVPPLSSSLSPIFHRQYNLQVELPNFLYQVEPWTTVRGHDLLAKSAKA